ncbi:MAG: hypothetical protein J0I12_33265 [Candidatus Eremiobacteraeota bacterium]|nr:hypothetical protein [Candidatus Eremiobacteraeota bacterium]
MKRALLIVLPLVAWAAGPILTINGRPAAHGLLQYQGKNWVCLDDLQAAGAQMNHGDLRLSPAGGAQQIAAVEGKSSEWLFNGLWRLQTGPATTIPKPYSDATGWGIDIEIRNGAQKEVSLHQTGAQLPTLALTDGTVLKADEGDWQLICFRPLLPGAAIKHQLKFYLPPGTPSQSPQRLILPIDPKFGLLRDTGLHYTVPAPSFRITY